MRRSFGIYAALLVGGFVAAMPASQSLAQEWTSAGRSWTGSYGFPDSAERTYRLQLILNQRRMDTGAFDAGAVYNTTNTYNTTYDSSVGDISVSAEAGATVDVDNRTAEGTGTSTYTVGSVNNTTNDISIDGSGNILDITSFADNSGCQNGAITWTTNEVMGGINISADANGASASSSTTTSSAPSSANCN
ncbi:hypothetical protein HKCCSP123_16975 [Rhodobacterales bacterium HKCCSP123]|nr:hypothetical protein [Rhodobacterales bacterium HKCCSP123]